MTEWVARSPEDDKPRRTLSLGQSELFTEVWPLSRTAPNRKRHSLVVYLDWTCQSVGRDWAKPSIDQLLLLFVQQSSTKKDKLFRFSSHFSLFNPLTVVLVLSCSLTKGITPKICRLCVCVLINKRSFEHFMRLDLVVVVPTNQQQISVHCAMQNRAKRTTNSF